MAYTSDYAAEEPSRASVDAMDGITVLEFGAPWCGHCQAAQPSLQRALASREGLAHLKIEDGPGRPLGRSFQVKLWPTLVVLRDGAVVARLVRPAANEIEHELGRL